ncbi:MAG: 50S ribosomal protein L23 [Anaerolineales bacterium]|nr:50S ribosomal protein L23 [Anaerolineales bacterium]
MNSLYDVLRRPLITEKTNYMNGDLRQYVFEVSQDASKGLIKDAVETIFKVKVMRVNVINMPAKKKRNLRSRRITTRRSSYKKAIITLAPGDSIPVFEGVR